ncbi:PspC domain-containing protein [Pontibacter harenae]|uniref:PspC domain-containing protein n=1 Tax=Pontibacter harenae TaxID=2894083 RepID=UPI001E58AADF|nr:PspC domain-containing protein [Pontibacter harenae]MCC9165713.1 PspC domain-containing protein [Pontibacter harenae]
MKKNISINLQGIIFHVEEDGYEQLSRYLASIRKYFSHYEGHEEIIADIESRIAEIFSTRLSPSKQVISQEDVVALITQMGDVTDFEILEPMEEEIPHYSYSTGGPETASAGANAGTGTGTGAFTAHAGPKKLYRDIYRKVIAGVCAGIANYLNIDALWIRLFFVFLVVLGILSAGFSTATGIGLYVILWIAMPQSALLPETTVKKLFRDPEDKKLGGVASGIAKYFGTDVTAIRILFLVSVFLGGFGIITYIILWIAVPEAVTLTERMQMQGDPVTLAGIERTLKDNLNMKDSNGQESTFAKLILLPIRLFAQLFGWLGRTVGPLLTFLITLIRVAAGVILIVVSVSSIIALVGAFLASLGVINTEYIVLGDYPASILMEGFPWPGLAAGFIVGLIPLLLLFVLGVSLIRNRFSLSPMVGWSMFAVWLVSLFTVIAVAASYAQNYRQTGEYEAISSFDVAAYETVTLDTYNVNLDYDRIYIDVQDHSGANIQVIKRVEARGRNEADAQRNAQMVSYRVIQRDSVLRFDSNYQFKEGAAFRNQELKVTLLLPRDKKLRLTRSFVYMLPSATFDRDYSTGTIVRNTWQVKGDMLECITCASDTLNSEEERNTVNRNKDDSDDPNIEFINQGGSVVLDKSDYSSNSQTFDYTNFNQVIVRGPYHVQLRQGNSYSVRVRGESRDIRNIRTEQDGQEISFITKRSKFNLMDNNTPVLIEITAPDISKIELSGAVKADLGTIAGDELELDLSGATNTSVNVRTRTFKVDIAGASSCFFAGTSDSFELDAAGACNINADNLKAKTVDIEVAGFTSASIYATSTLRADAAGASSIKYKGSPDNVTVDTSGPSKITRL